MADIYVDEPFEMGRGTVVGDVAGAEVGACAGEKGINLRIKTYLESA